MCIVIVLFSANNFMKSMEQTISREVEMREQLNSANNNDAVLFLFKPACTHGTLHTRCSSVTLLLGR